MRIVSPFRPFPPESDLHRELVDFDWIAALRMMRHSAEVACACPVHVITDIDTDLPLPCLRYATVERRLMLWNLEICLAYLRSEEFQCDTVMIEGDQLVYQPLTPFFVASADLGVLVRPSLKHRDSWKKVLNGVQFWAVAGKARLIGFYQALLDHARTLPESLLQWGADTEALRHFIEPVQEGLQMRSGVAVHQIDYTRVLEALSETQIKWISDGRQPWNSRPVLDFRWKRKRYMQTVYDLTIGAKVAS